MGSFVHTANNVIVINNEYRFPLELFNKLEPDYSLPEKMIYRTYVQGKTNIVTNGYTQLRKDIFWKEGDRYINRLSELLYLDQHLKIKEEERQEYVNRLKNNAK